MGVPPNGWFSSWKIPIKMDDEQGRSSIFRNLQTRTCGDIIDSLMNDG